MDIYTVRMCAHVPRYLGLHPQLLMHGPAPVLAPACRYLIGRTANTLLMGDLESCKLSEIPWQTDGSEKFHFENDRVCMVHYQVGPPAKVSVCPASKCPEHWCYQAVAVIGTTSNAAASGLGLSPTRHYTQGAWAMQHKGWIRPWHLCMQTVMPPRRFQSCMRACMLMRDQECIICASSCM